MEDQKEEADTSYRQQPPLKRLAGTLLSLLFYRNWTVFSHERNNKKTLARVRHSDPRLATGQCRAAGATPRTNVAKLAEIRRNLRCPPKRLMPRLITLQVCFPFTNVFFELFPRWIREIKPKGSGKCSIWWTGVSWKRMCLAKWIWNTVFLGGGVCLRQKAFFFLEKDPKISKFHVTELLVHGYWEKCYSFLPWLRCFLKYTSKGNLLQRL